MASTELGYQFLDKSPQKVHHVWHKFSDKPENWTEMAYQIGKLGSRGVFKRQVLFHIHQCFFFPWSSHLINCLNHKVLIILLLNEW